MSNTYEMMIHFSKQVDPVKVAMNLLRSWKESDREPLYIYGKKGECITPNEDIIKKILSIGEKGYVSVNLKTSKKKGSDKVELYFSNPSLKMRQANVCTINFSKNKIENSINGYTLEELVELLNSMAYSGPVIRGSLELDNILYDKKIWEIETLFAKQRGETSWPFLICWVTYLPFEYVEGIGGIKKFEELDLQVMRVFEDGSFIVRTTDYPYENHSNHLSKLIRINHEING